MGPTIFELWMMETENWVIKITKPNTPLALEATTTQPKC